MSDPRAELRLRALAWEARRRGVSYGILCVRLQPGEDEEILQRYADAMRINLRTRPKSDWEKARVLYDKGLSDREIAERLGRKLATVTGWRYRQGLPPNRRKGGGALHDCG